jgi:hypothetical protein
MKMAFFTADDDATGFLLAATLLGVTLLALSLALGALVARAAAIAAALADAPPPLVLSFSRLDVDNLGFLAGVAVSWSTS